MILVRGYVKLAVSIYRVKLFLALSALLVGIFLLSTTNFVSSSDPEPDVIYQAPNTHPAPDVAIIADETGLAIEVVGKAIAFQEAFGKYADELIARFPGQISSIYSDSSSGGTSLSTRGHVQFTGEVPPGIKPMKNVILTGGGALSIADHARRAELAAYALVEMGYQNHTTHSDAISNVIRVELHIPEAAPQPRELDIAVMIQEKIQADPRFQGRAATIGPLNLDLTISRGSGPIITLTDSRGGN